MKSPTPKKLYCVEFIVPVLPKTPNQLLGRHWRSRAGHAERWVKYVGRAIAIVGKPARPLKRANVTCTRISSGKLDPDNLYGSFKAPVDALVKLGVIENDSPDHIELKCFPEMGKRGHGKIRIKIEEVSSLKIDERKAE